jgi:biotin/methionine sulfoxide reductase
MGVSDGLAKTPEWAEGICGVPADRIASLARQAADHRTYMTLTYSLQRAHRGEMPYWAGIALAATLGQIGLPGGGIGFGHGSMGGVGHPRRDDVPGPEIPLPRNPHGRSIPVARIADMLLEPGGAYRFDGRDETYPDVGLIYWAGGNPFHHHQDLNRLLRAWHRPQTIVVHEQVWNAHAKLADIVLPATTTLEREDIGSSTRNPLYVAMRQVDPPPGLARDDHAIFSDLAEALGAGEAFTLGRSPRERPQARRAAVGLSPGHAAPPPAHPQRPPGVAQRHGGGLRAGRLPGPPRLARACRVAGRASGAALAAAHDLRPTSDAAAQPAGLF